MTDSELPAYAPLDPQRGGPGAVTRADVVFEARSWIGTPYVHQGRRKGVGVDCAGLVIGVAKALGLVEQNFDVTGYSRTPDGTSLIAHCDRLMDGISRNDVRPGDVLAVRFGHDPQHLGIVGDYMHGGLSLIHAYGKADGKGSVTEWRLTNRAGFRPVSGYRLRGVV